MLGFACSVPDCWLEVSLHPEGPATGQLDQGFPWFSLVPEQKLSWYPNSTLLCMLHMQPSQEECYLLGYENPVRTSQETHYVSATESSQLILCKI
jgi:hypothetical protein